MIVTDAPGKDVAWNIEATSPNILVHQGWRSSTLMPVDSETV